MMSVKNISQIAFVNLSDLELIELYIEISVCLSYHIVPCFQFGM